jgi:hypothetical protein
MVVRGIFIAFIGDWVHATRLCIRIPSKGILLISEPIPNPMVPQFDDVKDYKISIERQREIIVNEVITKLNKDDHPWAKPTEQHLLDVMGGATIIALRLACTGGGQKYPDDVFKTILPHEISSVGNEIGLSWQRALTQHADKKKEAIKLLKLKQQQGKKLPTTEEPIW